MIELQPWQDDLAYQVFSELDVIDHAEAKLWCGTNETYALFANWRNNASFSRIACKREGDWVYPFAIVAVVPNGVTGCAGAGLMARDHEVHRRELAQLVRLLQRLLPTYFGEMGLSRVEARSWSKHPTAPRLFRHLGFRHEATLPGFDGGAATFEQFAWTQPPED